MSDLSDWVWLAVIVLWVVLRAIPRLFRRKAAREAAETPRPAATPSTRHAAEGEERLGDVGPGPIEPR